MKAYIHSLTADGAEQQNADTPETSQIALLSVSETCLNDFNY